MNIRTSSNEDPINAICMIAKEYGLPVSIEELQTVKTLPTTAELSDSDLEQVAGGDGTLYSHLFDLKKIGVKLLNSVTN